MSSADAWNYAAPGGAYRSAGGWSARTRYAPSDFVTLLWREKGFMALVFIAILALGIAAAMTLKTSYTAYSSISVRLGQEYVYQPRSGDAGRGALPNMDDVVQTEIEIMQSRPVAERAIQAIGLARLYPKLNQGDKDAMDKAAAQVQKAFQTESAPDTSIIKVSFKHADKVLAARVLNALMEAYLARRMELLQPNAPAVQAQRQAADARLSDVDQAYDNFLRFNNIGDFDSERDTLKQAQNTLEQQRLQTAASLKDKQSRLGVLTARLAGLMPEQVVSRDVNMQNQTALNALLDQKTKLSAAYTDTSEPMRDVDQKIAETQKAISAHPTIGDAARRMGPNPVYQSLQNDQISVSAEVSGLRSQLAAVDEQLKQNTERQLKIASLQPQYDSLIRARVILQDSAKAFAQREQETLAEQSIASKGADNIRIVSRAAPPTKGTSLKKPVAVLTVLLAAFTALCAGLLRIFLSPGTVTPQIAGRTLDLPVLGAARMRR